MKPRPQPPQERPQRLVAAMKQILSLAVAASVALAARSSLADHYIVPSGSMLPTVEEGDRIVVDKLAYGFRLPFSQLYLTHGHDPRPGDVVVLISPETGIVLLKRVVAGPGQTVEVRDGQLIIDGVHVAVRQEGQSTIEQLGDVEHSLWLTNGGGPPYGPVTVPPDSFLVLGDNRGESHDGRSFGLVERGAIIGRALGSYYGPRGVGWRPL